MNLWEREREKKRTNMNPYFEKGREGARERGRERVREGEREKRRGGEGEHQKEREREPPHMEKKFDLLVLAPLGIELF